jgi:hypothetical protein
MFLFILRDRRRRLAYPGRRRKRGGDGAENALGGFSVANQNINVIYLRATLRVDIR